MDNVTYEKVDPLIDEVAEEIGKVLDSAELEVLRKRMTELAKALGSRYSVSLAMNVELFDSKEERCLPLLQMGLSGFEKSDLYHATNDSSPQRYVVDGEIEVVPHDRCPKCWGVWDFKFDNPSCRTYGATLGVGVKVLLDSDVCPHCEKGKVSMASPICEECGYEVNLSYVTWG